MTNIQSNHSINFNQNSIFSPSESKSIQGFLTEFDEDPIIANLSDQNLNLSSSLSSSTSTLSPNQPSTSKMMNLNHPNSSSFQTFNNSNQVNNPTITNYTHQSNWNSPLKSQNQFQFNRSSSSNCFNPLQIEFEPNHHYLTSSQFQSPSQPQSQSQNHSQNQNQSNLHPSQFNLQSNSNLSNSNQFSTLDQSSYKPQQKSTEPYHHHQSDLPPFSLISSTNHNPSTSFNQVKDNQLINVEGPSTPWIDKAINYHPIKFNSSTFSSNEKLNSQQLLQKHRHHQSLDSSIHQSAKPKQIRTTSNHSIPQSNPSILFPDRIPSSSSSSSNSSSNHSNHTNQSFQHQPLHLNHPHAHHHHHQGFNHQSMERNTILAIPASVIKKDKPGLLSQEQKRANHIASEQKRRAAIRQGYDKLCLVVPSLNQSNSSWKEEEEKLGKKKRKKSLINPNQSVVVEEVENQRTGSKSEAIVLAKTVEYLKELEIERKELLMKLKKLEKYMGEEICKKKVWEEKWNVILEI
ncbi:hypothetical protein DFH28DRAFT_247083 [Melampsora americana]|nr:hypothetical protein DFH28DRAFT_247083 [Melampsora americana]